MRLLAVSLGLSDILRTRWQVYVSEHTHCNFYVTGRLIDRVRDSRASIHQFSVWAFKRYLL
jgi:hypothetical protein